MSKAWAPGELLLTLHRERMARLNGYRERPRPVGGFATEQDAVNIDLDLAEEFPHVFHLERGQGIVTNEALKRLSRVEAGTYP